MGCAQSGDAGSSTCSAASVVPANMDASKYYKVRITHALPSADAWLTRVLAGGG